MSLYPFTLTWWLDRPRKRVACRVRTPAPQPLRSPAAQYAGREAGAPQLREGETFADLCGGIEEGTVSE